MNRLANKLFPILCALALGLGGAASGAQAATYMDTNATPSAAIQAVIQKANQEQAEALAQNNAAVMQDTATRDYYGRLVQTNQDLKANGVTAIELQNIAWGPVRISGATARAATDETWRTTFSDGTIDQSTDRNVYALVQQNGAWKIQADVHPDSEIQIPAPGQTTAPNGQQGSLNWSGYQATGGTFTAVNGTWTVPQPSTNSIGADAAWVGIGGITSHDLIQAGTEETVSGGQVSYNAWIETLPQASRDVALAIHAETPSACPSPRQSPDTGK